jgi:F-type H+-transporting ATPase subunit delta
VEEIARVYADALFEVARNKDKLDRIRDELSEFAEAVQHDRDMQVFLFSPYFSSAEKRQGIERAVRDADPEFVNFLELLIEKHRMPLIFRVQRRFEELWKEERRKLDVTLTSAVQLDPQVVEKVGAEIEKQTGRSVELRSSVDEDILGGLVLQVGNMVLDASVRNRLEALRKNIARAA